LTAGEKLWTFRAPVGALLTSAPALGPSLDAYFGSSAVPGGALYAVKPDGTLRWTFKESSGIAAPPAVVQNGTVVVQANSGYFYALAAVDGAVQWKTSFGFSSHTRPVPGSAGLVYVKSGTDSPLRAVRVKDGSLAWARPSCNFLAPAVAADGMVYVAVSAKINGDPVGLHAYTAAGQLMWRAALPGKGKAAPVPATEPVVLALPVAGCAWLRQALKGLGADGAGDSGGTRRVVVLGASDNTLYAFDGANGRLLWRYKAPGPLAGPPVASPEGDRLFLVTKTDLHAITLLE
jgi:outer membrane protein assembly factor BamB